MSDSFSLATQFCTLEKLLGFSQKKLSEFLAKYDSSFGDAFEEIVKSATLLKELKQTSKEVRDLHSKIASSLDALVKDNVTIVPLGSANYPKQLALIKYAPTVLFVKGDVSALHRGGVSIVGSRTASEEGLSRAVRAARVLKGLGYNVVSGLARGIDTAAHLGALQVGAHTIAVIGTPINKYYPIENLALQDSIALRGTLVSQFSPFHPMTRINFPIRNATMSGLTLATVIVEAGETSGALIQAQQCLKQHRKLFIMQNQIDKPGLKWPREFLKKGGIPLTKVEDLERELSKLNDLKPENSDSGQLGLL